MRNPIEFELFVRQPVDAVMEQMERDAAAALQIDPDELNRAIFGWVMGRLGDNKPEWLETELDRLKS